MKSKIKSIKIVSYLWLGAMAGAGVAFLTQIVLTRALGVEKYGLFSAAIGTVTLITPLAGFGIAPFWLKAFGQEGWQGTRWLPPSFRFVGLSTAFIVLTLLTWAVYGPHDELTTKILSILCFLILGQVTFELVSSKLQLEARYGALAMWQFVPALLKFVFVATFFLWAEGNLTPLGIASGYSFVAVLTMIIGVLSLLKFSREDVQLAGHGERHAPDVDKLSSRNDLRITDLVSETWVFGMAGLFHLVYFQSNIVLLKYIVGDEAAGLYNAAFLILTAIYILPSVVYSKFLLPKIHRWANHDLAKLRETYIQGNWIMLALGALAALSVYMLAPYGIPLLFGEKYKEAISVAMLLSFAIPFRFLASSVGSVLSAKDNMRSKVKVMGTVALLNIVLNLLLINYMGMKGAAITTIVCEAALLFAYYRLVKGIYIDRGWKVDASNN